MIKNIDRLVRTNTTSFFVGILELPNSIPFKSRTSTTGFFESSSITESRSPITFEVDSCTKLPTGPSFFYTS